MNKNYTSILGLMSGTSLDGLDMALCEFSETPTGYSYQLMESRTIDYMGDWKKKMFEIKDASAENYFKLHADYGKFIGSEINHLIKENNLKPNAVASHGHTVFHQPALGFSTQLGCGATIAATSQLTTVCDFRSLDIANNGQGAPLVPIGDKLLFGDYQACLNIGGIANISFDEKNGNRIAYDVCEANMLLNYLSQKLGYAYDNEGEIAKSGNVNLELLKMLNQNEFYLKNGAKSIGREWFEKNILLHFENSNLEIKELLATANQHIASIISNELISKKINNVLISGGGAFNSFLIETITKFLKQQKPSITCNLIIPNNNIINYKEAIIFAFLGYLRLNKKVNTLKSVTGATLDSVGGAVYYV